MSPGEGPGQWSLGTHNGDCTLQPPLVTLDKMRKIITFCVIWEIYLASSGNLFTKEHIVKQSRILNLLADLWRFITNSIDESHWNFILEYLVVVCVS